MGFGLFLFLNHSQEGGIGGRVKEKVKPDSKRVGLKSIATSRSNLGIAVLSVIRILITGHC